ncbi:unnamed protein product [Dibothriocephalus latus]|uniref:GIY-YIG domain-containing protein n=1 Tax=Dibothriocephalus latus TaxID=60516 RepID=A0A3P7KWY3_DIBLA|nr:unnamed protein product [Dibothriocephalus latus]
MYSNMFSRESYAGLIAEAVLQRLEQLVFSSDLTKFWARYVDDTFVIPKGSHVQAFKALLNSNFPDIQFIMEEEVGNHLPSLMPKLQNCVDGGNQEEIRYLHALFKASGYPKSFIHKCLKKPRVHRSSEEKPKFWLAIPYVKDVSGPTARILEPFGIGVVHRPDFTITHQVIKLKDPLPATEPSALVYSILCKNYGAIYVGETGKRLSTRLYEHQLVINRKKKLSLVYGHMQQLNHDFTFEKLRVIARFNEKMARLVLEGWFSTGIINRAIDLNLAYQALRARLVSTRPGTPKTTTLTTVTQIPDALTHKCHSPCCDPIIVHGADHHGQHPLTLSTPSDAPPSATTDPYNNPWDSHSSMRQHVLP